MGKLSDGVKIKNRTHAYVLGLFSWSLTKILVDYSHVLITHLTRREIIQFVAALNIKLFEKEIEKRNNLVTSNSNAINGNAIKKENKIVTNIRYPIKEDEVQITKHN